MSIRGTLQSLHSLTSPDLGDTTAYGLANPADCLDGSVTDNAQTDLSLPNAVNVETEVRPSILIPIHHVWRLVLASHRATYIISNIIACDH